MVAPTPVSTHTGAVQARFVHPAVAPFAVFCVALALYLGTLTQVHTFDALSYITSVEDKPLAGVLFPHHLAYGPLSKLALALAQWSGSVGGAALPMQVVSAVSGAMAVAIFFASLRRLTRRIDLALVAALLLGGAYGFWYFAVETDVYAVSTLAMALCVDRLLSLSARPTRRDAFLLGLAHSAALLFHQANILLVVAVGMVAGFWVLGFGFWNLSDRRPTTDDQKLTSDDRPSKAPFYVLRSAFYVLRFDGWSRVVAVWWPYPVTGVLVVGGAYLAAARTIGFGSWAEFGAWLSGYAQTGWWGGAITTQKWADTGTGLADTLAQPGGALLGLLLIGLFVLHLRGIGGRARNRKTGRQGESETGDRTGGAGASGRRGNPGERLDRTGGRVVAVAFGVWLAVHAAFVLWWEPDNIKFWIAALLPALTLLALALRETPRWGASIWIALAVAGTTGSINYDSITRRGDARTDLQRVIARAVADGLRPADLALVPDGMLELYLPYYHAHANYLSLNQALFDSGRDWRQACGAVRQRIDAALHAGAAVVLADEVLHPAGELLERHRLGQSQIDACFESYRGALEPLGLPAPVPTYWRLPPAQALAERTGWRFTTFSGGWQAQNVTGERFDGSWRFVPGVDPALLSPLLDLDAGRYRAIEIRLANGTRARDAQLFYAGPDQAINETRMVRWTLGPGNAPTTYLVDLRGAPGWDGTITRLRLDPVGVGAGGEIRVEWIRLVR